MRKLIAAGGGTVTIFAVNLLIKNKTPQAHREHLSLIYDKHSRTRKADISYFNCLLGRYIRESGDTSEEILVMRVEQQSPVIS